VARNMKPITRKTSTKLINAACCRSMA
jgi:hypothetical protein